MDYGDERELKWKVEMLCDRRYRKDPLLPEAVSRRIRLRPEYGRTCWIFEGPGFQATWIRKGPGKGSFLFDKWDLPKVLRWVNEVDKLMKQR